MEARGKVVRKDSEKPQDCNRYKLPTILTGLLLPNTVVLGKTYMAGKFQGPPRSLIHSFAMTKLSVPQHLACTLGVHTSPKREPTTAKGPPSVLRTTYSVAPGWMLVPGSLQLSTTEGQMPPGPFALKPYRSLIREVGGILRFLTKFSFSQNILVNLGILQMGKTNTICWFIL